MTSENATIHDDDVLEETRTSLIAVEQRLKEVRSAYAIAREQVITTARHSRRSVLVMDRF